MPRLQTHVPQARGRVFHAFPATDADRDMPSLVVPFSSPSSPVAGTVRQEPKRQGVTYLEGVVSLWAASSFSPSTNCCVCIRISPPVRLVTHDKQVVGALPALPCLTVHLLSCKHLVYCRPCRRGIQPISRQQPNVDISTPDNDGRGGGGVGCFASSPAASATQLTRLHEL